MGASGVDPSKQLHRAFQQFWEGHSAEAARRFRRLLNRHPDHPLRDDAAFGLALTLSRQRKLEAARKQFRAVMERHSDTALRGEALYQLARLDVKTGRVKRARQRLDAFLSRYPAHVLHHLVRRERDRLASSPESVPERRARPDGRFGGGDTDPLPPLRLER